MAGHYKEWDQFLITKSVWGQPHQHIWHFNTLDNRKKLPVYAILWASLNFQLRYNNAWLALHSTPGYAACAALVTCPNVLLGRPNTPVFLGFFVNDLILILASAASRCLPVANRFLAKASGPAMIRQAVVSESVMWLNG